MDCPGCTLSMTTETYDGNYGTTVEIDVCHHCNGFWFDAKESVRLAPRATLQLFKSMAAATKSSRATLVKDKRCPRCTVTLTQTTDLQRMTRFTYFQCEEHGRYTTFFHFLREKDLLRQPTPKQLAELKRRVKKVQCSNCGGPIELEKGEVCEYCEAPLSVLSTETLEKTVKALEQKATQRAINPTALAAELAMQKQLAEREFRFNDIQDAAGVAEDLVVSSLRLFWGM
jgi:Zn-finger nucleic acid-binding protein